MGARVARLHVFLQSAAGSIESVPLACHSFSSEACCGLVGHGFSSLHSCHMRGMDACGSNYPSGCGTAPRQGPGSSPASSAARAVMCPCELVAATLRSSACRPDSVQLYRMLSLRVCTAVRVSAQAMLVEAILVDSVVRPVLGLALKLRPISRAVAVLGLSWPSGARLPRAATRSVTIETSC